LDPMKTTRYMV